jgi:hypothetical protein
MIFVFLFFRIVVDIPGGTNPKRGIKETICNLHTCFTLFFFLIIIAHLMLHAWLLLYNSSTWTNFMFMSDVHFFFWDCMHIHIVCANIWKEKWKMHLSFYVPFLPAAYANCWFQKCLFCFSAKKRTCMHVLWLFIYVQFSSPFLKNITEFKAYITLHHITSHQTSFHSFTLTNHPSTYNILFLYGIWIQCCLPSSTCPACAGHTHLPHIFFNFSNTVTYFYNFFSLSYHLDKNKIIL